MRERDKFNANERREWLFAQAGRRCQVCGRALESGVPQLAHRIPQKKRYLALYGKEVIHHDLNLVPVCSLKCNAKVDLNGYPIEIEKLVTKIRGNL